MKLKEKHLISLLLYFLILGCGQNEQPQKKEDSLVSASKAEEELFSAPDKALPELIKRLRSNLKMQDGLLMIRDGSLIRLLNPESGDKFDSIPGANGIFVLPVNASWEITCGLGIDVAFGNSMIGSRNEVIDNKIKIWLTNFIFISRSSCEALAPALGKEILTIINGI